MQEIRTGLAAAAILAASALPVFAQAQPAAAGPTLVGQFGDWGVYVSQNPRTKVCYVLSQPKDRQPDSLKRDPGYFFVSTRPGENIKNEVSIMVGFPIKEGSEATAQIGDASFALYTKAESAWVHNISEEARLVEALRKGKDAVVKSTSTRGNVTTDRYSLSGIAQALDRVAQECR
jgi:invasion protein IalB